MMVLREEFFPLMEEVKNSVAIMTKGAQGNTPDHNSLISFASPNSYWQSIDSQLTSLPSELLDCDDLHSVIRLVLKAGNFMNAVGIFLYRMFCFPNSMRSMSLIHFKCLEIYSTVYCSSSGQLQCQCHWLQDELSAETGRHQSQQAWHEPRALCCQGEEEMWNFFWNN